MPKVLRKLIKKSPERTFNSDVFPWDRDVIEESRDQSRFKPGGRSHGKQHRGLRTKALMQGLRTILEGRHKN